MAPLSEVDALGTGIGCLDYNPWIRLRSIVRKSCIGAGETIQEIFYGKPARTGTHPPGVGQAGPEAGACWCLGTLVNASVLVVVLWQSISHLSLIIWFSVTLCLVLQRTIILLRFRPASISADQSARVDRWFIGGVGLSGIAWGCVAIFLFPVNSPTHQILIVFVLCGMVAGAAETFAPILPAFAAFALSRTDTVSHSLSHHWRGCLHCNGLHYNILYRPDCHSSQFE